MTAPVFDRVMMGSLVAFSCNGKLSSELELYSCRILR